MLKELSIGRGPRSNSLPSSRRRTDQAKGLPFDVRAALFALLGKDITQIDGLGPYLSLKLIAECGDDLFAWPSAKHFTSWLCLAPSNKISGGKVLSSRTRRCGSRAAALLRLAAVTVGRTDTALSAFYRRLSARIGKAKAVTAAARKIAVLFYNAVRHGMEYVDPGASFYEKDLFSSSWSRHLASPFLRNRSPASARRSWHAATSRRSPVPHGRRLDRTHPQPRSQAASSTT